MDDIYERLKPQQREKFVKDMSKFVTWLKDQEEEDEEEEEEEEDEDESDDEDSQ